MNGLRRKRGASFLEIMVACAILVLTCTAALRLYLDLSFLVSQGRSKTTAVSHAKSILEEIRNWSNVTQEAVEDMDWEAWLATQEGAQLLPDETIYTTTGDLIEFAKPKKVTVTVAWNERQRPLNISLTGGFLTP